MRILRDDNRKDPAVLIILDLSRRLLHAARSKDDKERDRIFALLEEMSWAYPDAQAALAGVRNDGRRGIPVVRAGALPAIMGFLE